MSAEISTNLAAQFKMYMQLRRSIQNSRQADKVELFVEGSRREDRTVAALPTLFPFFEFTRAMIVRMPGFAGTSVTAIEFEPRAFKCVV
jgi:hypothetical protein